MNEHKIRRIISILSVLGIWLLIGTISFHHLEGWNYIQSFYFSAVSVTTVGYGDIHPTSDLSMLFTSFYVLLGVAIGLTVLGMLGKEYIDGRLRKIEARNNFRKDKFIQATL